MDETIKNEESVEVDKVESDIFDKAEDDLSSSVTYSKDISTADEGFVDESADVKEGAEETEDAAPVEGPVAYNGGKVRFLRGRKRSLMTYANTNSFFLTTDEGELYVGTYKLTSKIAVKLLTLWNIILTILVIILWFRG